jgi:hypothetical protein
LGAAVLVGCSMLVACDIGRRDPVAAGDPSAMAELRTYEVAPEHQDDLQRVLRQVLGAGESRLGRVTAGPSGTFIVVAPARIQTGIRNMLSNGFTPSPAPTQVKLTYWLLVGRPVDSGAELAAYSVSGPRRLSHLEQVMTQLVAAQGSAEFTLLEEVQVLSMVQDQGRAYGKLAQVEQTVTQAGDQMVAYVSISMPQANSNRQYAFESQISLRAGQYLVVGQVGLDGRSFGPNFEPFPDSQPGDDLTLYYVMMAEHAP